MKLHVDYDQIAFRHIVRSNSMQQMTLLHKKFAKELPFIHKTRLNCLMSTCMTASTGNKLFLTGLGRNTVFFKQATGKPAHLGHALLTEKHKFLFI